MDKYPGKLVESKISLVMEKHPDKLELISTLGETKKNAQPYWYYSSVSESCFGDILISESDDSKRMDAWLLRFLSRHSLFQLSASDKNASCSWFQNTVILILNSWHYFLMSYVDASTWPLLDQCHPGKTNSLSCRPPPTVVDWFSRVSRLNILNRWRGQKDIVNIQDITKLPLPSDLLAY